MILPGEVRMTEEQAQELLVRVEAALLEVGAAANYELFVDSCTDPLCDCGYDVWWTDETSDTSDEGLETLWRAFCASAGPDMMCLVCWRHQFKVRTYQGDCLSKGTVFVQDCGIER